MPPWCALWLSMRSPAGETDVLNEQKYGSFASA